MYYLYVLKLEQNKYYVGITQNPKARYLQHTGVLPGGSLWARKYKVEKLLALKSLKTNSRTLAEAYENTITNALIRSKGIDNVRGGSFTTDWIHKSRLKRLSL